jgi:hypothetical protein
MARRRVEKRNQDWLARQLKVKQQRVSQLIRREGWRWGAGNWSDAQLEEIQVWHAGLREENPATASEPGAIAVTANPIAEATLGDVIDPHELLKLVSKPEQRIKLAGVIERMAKVKVDRELLLGGYQKREEVNAGRIARVQAVRARAARLALAGAGEAFGVDRAERLHPGQRVQRRAGPVLVRPHAVLAGRGGLPRRAGRAAGLGLQGQPGRVHAAADGAAGVLRGAGSGRRGRADAGRGLDRRAVRRGAQAADQGDAGDAEAAVGRAWDDTKHELHLATMPILGLYAGSSSKLEKRKFRYAIGDEINLYRDQPGQPSALGRLLIRITTWGHRGRAIFGSKPTTTDGAITKGYESCPDKRRFFMPCARCGMYHEWLWSR